MSIFSNLDTARQKKVLSGLQKYGRSIFTFENNAGVIYGMLRGETPEQFGGKPPVVHHEPIEDWRYEVLM